MKSFTKFSLDKRPNISLNYSSWEHNFAIKRHNACSLRSEKTCQVTFCSLNTNSGDKGRFQPRKKKHASLKEEAIQSNTEIANRLIPIFEERQNDWRKLIAGSKQWPVLSDSVFTRLEELAVRAGEADDIDRQLELRRMSRRLKTVSDGVASHAEMVRAFREVPSHEWEAMVVNNRRKLSSEFFDYVEMRIKAVPAGQEQERDALAALATQIFALVEATDRVIADQEAMNSAGEKFASLLESIEQGGSIDAADKILDEMAASGSIDPALLLTMAKAYNGVKESQYTQEEVKDVMAHLYFRAKESFAQMAPPEVRILKFLLSIESPVERSVALEEAFKPGAEFSTEGVDYLNTTPHRLMNLVDNILSTYAGARSAGGGEMLKEAASLMHPEVIVRMRELHKDIKRYM